MLSELLSDVITQVKFRIRKSRILPCTYQACNTARRSGNIRQTSPSTLCSTHLDKCRNWNSIWHKPGTHSPRRPSHRSRTCSSNLRQIGETKPADRPERWDYESFGELQKRLRCSRQFLAQRYIDLAPKIWSIFCQINYTGIPEVCEMKVT